MPPVSEGCDDETFIRADGRPASKRTQGQALEQRAGGTQPVHRGVQLELPRVEGTEDTVATSESLQ
jgi:hypothetical protein